MYKILIHLFLFKGVFNMVYFIVASVSTCIGFFIGACLRVNKN